MMWALQQLKNAATTALVVSFVMFILLFIGPNPLEQLKENPNFNAEDIARIAEMYGWDKPWYQQYLGWLSGMFTGDWGESILTQRPAKDVIMERLPLTLLLTGSAQLLSLMIAVPMGVFLALRKGTRTDLGAALGSFTLMATPSFLIALLMQMAALKWMHATGDLLFYTAGAPDSSSPGEWVRRLTLPVLSLALIQIAAWSRYQRSEFITVMQTDFIRCSTAKGIPRRRLYFRHALPNTLLPIITIVAMDVAGLLGGAIVTETIFDLPGIGSLLMESVKGRDVVVALDLVVIGSLLMVAANTAADLAYGLLDTRAKAAS